MLNWEPFRLCAPQEMAPSPRNIETPEGVGDRLRAAAFAELQAREAFRWAADHFEDAPLELREAWRALIPDEARHYGWIMARMEELGIRVDERPVSDRLWQSLATCKSGGDFAIFIANAEERGRQAALRFAEQLASRDPATAAIFGKIADEEKSHVALPARFFPNDQRLPRG